MTLTLTIRLLFKCKNALIIAAILPTIIIVNNIPHVLADPAHCDQSGWPSCYDVGYGDGQANPGTSCPSGHSDNFCGGWAAGATSSSSSSSSCNSSGCNGDFICQNPNGGPPDCPVHISLNHHTADYWFGYKIGQEDGRPGVFDIGSSCDHAPDHNFSNCSAGYTDGYKSICGTTYSRLGVACNSGKD
jgi:hypothetical protein